MNVMTSTRNTGTLGRGSRSAGAAAPSDSQDTFTRCSCSDEFKPMTQLEMNEQARRNYAEAQAELREVYYKLAARKHDWPAGECGEGSLCGAQKAWEQFAEAEALQQASAYQGGSIYPLIYLDAKREATESRTAQLASQLARMEQS